MDENVEHGRERVAELATLIETTFEVGDGESRELATMIYAPA